MFESWLKFSAISAKVRLISKFSAIKVKPVIKDKKRHECMKFCPKKKRDNGIPVVQIRREFFNLEATFENILL